MKILGRTFFEPAKLKVAGWAGAPIAPVQAVAAPLPPQGGPGDQQLVNYIPPFGTNPPNRPVNDQRADYATRSIYNDPRELWYLALPSKLSPKYVLQILRSALGGDIWQQWQLLTLMLDTWPMLRKCSHEVRQAVSNVRYTVRPWTDKEGDEPDDDAKERADTVRRAMRNWRPDPFTDEKGFQGFVYDVSDAMLNGITVDEVLWNEPQRLAGGGYAVLPRAGAWVHPRHFTFGNNGRLVLFDEMYNRLNWALAQQPGQNPDTNKFMCAQFMSKSGSSLGAGLVRPLAWDWSAVVYNREWMFQFAQTYGNPFLSLKYPKGWSNDEITKLEQFAAQAGSQRWLVSQEGTESIVTPAQSLGPDNPQRAMMKLADDHCMLLLLGQNLTSESPQQGGTRAQGEVHMGVRREQVEGVSKWLASSVLTEQLARAALRLNYDDEEKCPTVEADFSEPEDPAAAAARIQTIVNCRIPIHAEEMYEVLKISQPEEGDNVFLDGKVGYLAAPLDEVGGETAPSVPIDENGEPVEPDSALDLEGRPIPGTRGVSGRAALERAVSKMTTAEIRELRELVVAARKAPKQNGEWTAVKAKLSEAACRRSNTRRVTL